MLHNLSKLQVVWAHTNTPSYFFRQNLSGEEREAYLRDLRQQKRALVDENAPDPGSGVCVLPLPEPRAFPLPSGISSLQFGRVLGFTEFVTCYQSLLTENTLSLGEAFYSSRVRSLAADLCGKGSESDEEFDSDEEEEATLTSTAAGLPKASIRGLRRLSLDRVLQAVSERSMSASAYRCLTRPMSALLRLVFLNEQFSVSGLSYLVSVVFVVARLNYRRLYTLSLETKGAWYRAVQNSNHSLHSPRVNAAASSSGNSP